MLAFISGLSKPPCLPLTFTLSPPLLRQEDSERCSRRPRRNASVSTAFLRYLGVGMEIEFVCLVIHLYVTLMMFIKEVNTDIITRTTTVNSAFSILT